MPGGFANEWRLDGNYIASVTIDCNQMVPDDLVWQLRRLPEVEDIDVRDMGLTLVIRFRLGLFNTDYVIRQMLSPYVALPWRESFPH